SDSNLGSASSALDINGGTLRFDASFDPGVGRAVKLGSVGATIDTNGASAVFVQSILGAGHLTKIGAGTLTLSGANAYTGGTTISGGGLQVGSGGATGDIFGDITDDGG